MPDPRAIDDVLVDLCRHPGWEILRYRVLAQQEKESEEVRQAIMRGPGALDTHKLERQRGHWAGARWLLRQADRDFSAYRRREKQETTARE